MVTVVSVVGARPQFVKVAVVSRELCSRPGVREVLLHTGQHYDDEMSRTFFRELGIPEPHTNLGVGSANHGAQTGEMLRRVEEFLTEVRPDWVVVYGDTNTTLAGALAAVKLHFPVAHVEAGLRSFNRRMPEEVNRVLTDHAADLLFAPTDAAVRNLLREGIGHHRIELVGDVMYDAALYYQARTRDRSRILESLGIEPGRFILATLHRAENTNEPNRLRSILQGLCEVSREIPVVLPLHPRTRTALEREGLWGRLPATLWLLPPVSYLDMIRLERDAGAILTDSGGVQKEAYFYGVPCVTLREETEWVELVEVGANVLVGCDPERIRIAALEAVRKGGIRVRPELYGGGNASRRVVDILLTR